jgi:hypothetical protein
VERWSTHGRWDHGCLPPVPPSKLRRPNGWWATAAPPQWSHHPGSISLSGGHRRGRRLVRPPVIRRPACATQRRLVISSPAPLPWPLSTWA